MSKSRRTRAGAPAAVRGASVRNAAALAASLALGACALSANRPPTEPEPDLRVVRYSVERGDRLSLIAREFTGDMALWRTIADLNGIDDPRKLAVGQLLEIPVALIPEDDREARLAASVPLGVDDADTDNAATRLARLRERTVADAAATPPSAPAVPQGPDPEAGRALRVAAEPVVVSAVRSREAFELSPLDAADAAATGSRAVQVTGGYTPKGVYESPAAQSRVLMRLTPGTVLPLERSVDGWSRVATSAGPGYVRAADARVVGAGDAAGE